jgi:hypothetical protein
MYEVVFGLDGRWHIVDTKLPAINLGFAFAAFAKDQALDMATALNIARTARETNQCHH